MNIEHKGIKMVKIEFSLFYGVEWAYKNVTIVSETKDKALEILEKEYPLEFRYKPYSEPKEDSLEIEDIEESDYFIL